METRFVLASKQRIFQALDERIERRSIVVDVENAKFSQRDRLGPRADRRVRRVRRVRRANRAIVYRYASRDDKS